LRRRTLPRLLVGLTATAVALTGFAGSSSARSPRTLPTPTSIPRFAPVYMGWVTKTKPTASAAISAAKAYDVIAASSNLAPYIADMRRANPSVVVVGYVDALFTRRTERHPENWYAHDKRGHKVTTPRFGNYLMDPSNVEWRRTVAQDCAQLVAQTHYDGCFLDNLGQGSLSVGYVTAAPYKAGKPWSPRAWMAATSQLARAVQSANGRSVLVANGLGRGGIFFGPNGTSPLLSSVAGAMSETWLRVASDKPTKYRSEADWKADVDMLAAGGRVLVTAKLWVRSTPAQATAWHKYALASFLLGNSGRAFFNFSASQSWSGLAADSPMDRVNIGRPTGGYRQVSGAYARSYTGGIALVHPTNGTVRVALPAGQYRDLDGRTVSGSVSLNSHEGTVLTRR